MTDERIRSLLQGAPDIYKLARLEEDDSAFRLRTFAVEKRQPKYRNGWTSDLRSTSRVYKRWFDLPDLHLKGWAIIFRVHDPDDTGEVFEFMPGWVPPEGEQDADRWIAVLNQEIRDRLRGKNHVPSPAADLEITDDKLRLYLQQGGSRLYSIKEHDDHLALMALRISKSRPEFMIDGREWHPLRPQSRLYKRWFEWSDAQPTKSRGWAVIFRMFEPNVEATEPYEYFVGWAPPEKERDVDEWVRCLNAQVAERLGLMNVRE